MFNTPWRCAVLAAVLVAVGPAPAFAQPTIVLDYTFDTNNFFPVGSQQRVTLQTAANRLTARLTDSLTAITPGGGNTWTAVFPNPGTGTTQNVSNPTIAANTIYVYAGGRVLGGSTLGIGGPGGFSAGGTQAWLDTVQARGQTGAQGPASGQTDFGPWGGAITFDTNTNWNFSVSSGPVSGQVDFLSVAEHELGHLLGFGTANSFKNLISGSSFTGPHSTALNGGVNPALSADLGHWASGTSYLGQECAMTPSLTVGTRKEFTELDFAGLNDLGWQLTPVPEPATVLGLAVAALGLAGAVRRRRAAPETSAAA
jgi:hypothetical protein